MPETFRIVFAASEVVPFAKTGGLADVVGSLPRALQQRGHSCVVVLPLHKSCHSANVAMERTDLQFQIPIGSEIKTGRLWKSRLPESDVPVWLIEQGEYFGRDNPASGLNLYEYVSSWGGRRDYPDNCQRFAFFSRAIPEILPLIDFWPDVFHLNDWQTGLTPVYLNQTYNHHPNAELREKYQKIQCLLTIHNLAYQGNFPADAMQWTGLDWRLFNYLQLELYNMLSFLKGGIVFSQLLSTVSDTYSREIQTPEHGWGMQDVLRERASRLTGIVNGVDYGQWDPAIDLHLPARYSPDSLTGKARCKEQLQTRFFQKPDPRKPLLGVVARLVEQKGIGLIVPIIPGLMDLGCQLVVLGMGERHFQEELQRLQSNYPQQIGLMLGFDEATAHQIEAGADVFLMPSIYEPSGLNQLYSLKYGTVPVVRSTGGLVDTVVDYSPEKSQSGEATGFHFGPKEPHALWVAVNRAVQLWREEPETWKKLMLNGMKQDWSWNRSASEYEKLYQRLTNPAS